MNDSGRNWHYHPEQSGSYCEICSNSACSSDTSTIIDVIINSINQNKMDIFTIYPNPVQDYFTLKFADYVKGDFILRICSELGKPEWVLKLNINGHGRDQKVEVADLRQEFISAVDDKFGTCSETAKF
jgi:hypothetical protein